MKIIFRADASVQIGTGHIMRCLTLAGELREKGVEVAFVCRELPGNLCHVLASSGHLVQRLPYDPGQNSAPFDVNWEKDALETAGFINNIFEPLDWLVVDHYALDRRWEKYLRPYVKKIMVIDDLANRPHDCDLLLDQNLYKNMENRYDTLISEHCIKLLGPQYALLRPEFKEARKKLKQRQGSIQRVLIFFGGSDPTNETAKALEAISLLDHLQLKIDVVVGAANPNKERIKEKCLTMQNTTFYYQVDNMAELMAGADLAVGAGGSATWERCCLGLPSLVSILADNQYELANNLAKQGAIIYLGWAKDLNVLGYFEAISKITNIQILKMSQQGAKLVDGEGCKRVVDKMLN